MKKVIIASAVAGAFLMASCGGSKTTTGVTKGSLSEFDSLSYAVGLNLASMAKTQLADLPLDYDVLVESMVQSALGTNKVAHEDATAVLQDYFMTKRQPRAIAVEKSRDEADSVALANGADSAAVASARAQLTSDESMFESAEERTSISSSLGNDLGNSIVSSKIPAKTVWIEQAFTDLAADETKMTEQVANGLIQRYFTETLPENNRVASEEWLASIEKKSGVQKTESGILYKVEKSGDDSIMATDDRDVVKVKYTGKTREGKVFDSSRYDDMDEQRKEYMKTQSPDGTLPEDGEIIEFPLNRVIPGWTEGMKLVGKGGRISLWIPSDLAYGSRGAGADIAANEALYFDVELIDVVPYEEPAPAAETAVEEE
ncbi:MAG: FKBP-type peptidyl-prolyl cis-trans isomerase N-terminal domain-containing protein [Rikenellaceae bacterium]